MIILAGYSNRDGMEDGHSENIRDADVSCRWLENGDIRVLDSISSRDVPCGVRVPDVEVAAVEVEGNDDDESAVSGSRASRRFRLGFEPEAEPEAGIFYLFWMAGN
jgi:hypothetical protein